MAAAYFAFAFQIVFSWRVGPIAAALVPGRGIHTGDVLAVPVVVLGMIFAALGAGWLRRSLRPPVPAVVVPRGWERRSG